MVSMQSPHDLTAILGCLVGEEIAQLQVLGINSLKAVAPSPLELVGRQVTATEVNGRIVTFQAGNLRAQIDLQRTGRLAWLDHATPASLGDPSLPTLRLLLASGSALDFREPAKTKRISVRILPA